MRSVHAGVSRRWLPCLALVALALPSASTAGAVTVAEIQAKAHRSPLEGELVSGVEGIVTAIREVRNHHGFWLTAVPGDGDPATSEGLLVVTGEALPEVALGDRVRVAGRVAELTRRDNDLPVTSLVDPEVEILASSQPLPQAIALGPDALPIRSQVIDNDGLADFEPEEDVLDQWESLEGMRVEIQAPRVVGADDSYGNVTLVAGEVAEPSSRGGLLLSSDELHAHRVEVDTRPGGAKPSFWVGDELGGTVTGVVDYGFGSYRLHLSEALPAVTSTRSPRERTSLVASKEHLTIGSYNVLNLSVVSESSHFERLAASIVVDLGSPDIVALQEIQDDSGRKNDGTVSANETLERLTKAISEAKGPSYVWRQIDPSDGEDGGVPGGNIRVAFLVNPDRVQIVDRGTGEHRGDVELLEGPHIDPSPGRLGVGHDCFAPDEDGLNGSRKTLVLEVRFDGETIFLLNNHWTSKFGDDSLFGARQPAVRPSGAERLCQAEVVRDFVGRILDLDARAAVVVLGDFNEYDYQPALQALASEGLVNLTRAIPRADRYSYVFRGRAGVIDQVIVSPRLAAENEPEIDIVHVNADFPASDRASDHDPVVVRLRFAQ